MKGKNPLAVIVTTVLGPFKIFLNSFLFHLVYSLEIFEHKFLNRDTFVTSSCILQ